MKKHGAADSDRLENGIIVLLVCSALFLVYQSGLVQNFVNQA
ncbi:MAG: hypothetical protein ACLR6W_07870 [Evtepia sp.]